MFKETKNIIISTGNILNVNRKAAQKTSEELFDCLKATLAEPAPHSKAGNIYRSDDDLHTKITEHKRNDIKIGAKIFLNNSSINNLKQAIDNLLYTLNVTYLDNFVLAYHPKSTLSNGVTPHVNGVGLSNGKLDDDIESNGSVIEWGAGNRGAMADLKTLWQVLEKYANEKKICQLGIADLDTNSLVELYESCKVKPTIAQINLSACCVVPPSLQDFCTKHDIQLLTHSDPEEIMTLLSMNELNISQYKPSWTTRYQVHIKCRGVLAAKGFILAAEQTESINNV